MSKIKKIGFAFLLNLILVWGSCQAQSIELKNNFFYLDNQKFFIKGIGYEVGAYPGMLPWNRPFNADILRFDMARIEGAGFNTIRTWAAFTNQELGILAEFDIKIIMGIWIDPHADFGDPAFINAAKNQIRSVLSYSKNYPNIIAYLIMNEPLPETVFDAGYQETETLWKDLIEIIHTEHPDRAVSIANTSNGTYINQNIFDFSAFNVYIYNPVTVNHSHGYTAFTEYLLSLQSSDKPLIITEYGLSVSPTGPGNWGYGGNTLQEQKEGILHMYKSLIDGGASGSCVFNYSDGWWKGGNEFVHDNTVEEYFGFIEYQNLNDFQGIERPVWQAVKDYQSAIITSPKNGGVYRQKIPVELFCNDNIDFVDILYDNVSIYNQQLVKGYLLDSLNIANSKMNDINLVFNFFDENNVLVKSEEKSILLNPENQSLPTLSIETSPAYFSETNSVSTLFQITNPLLFETSLMLDYAYYPHQGFDYGQAFSRNISLTESQIISQSFYIQSQINVHTFAGGFDFIWGDFTKRIYAQKILAKNQDETTDISEFTSATKRLILYPNPAITTIRIQGLTVDNKSKTYSIFNTLGEEYLTGLLDPNNLHIDISNLQTGIYIITILSQDQSVYTAHFVKI